MSEQAFRKVRMSPEFMEQFFVRDSEGNRVSVEWGEPDADGFYVPIFSVDYEDNIVARLKEYVQHKPECWKNQSLSYLGVGGKLASCTCGRDKIFRDE